eukprot:4730182-Alexandrium_andersonii.AAC.1
MSASLVGSEMCIRDRSAPSASVLISNSQSSIRVGRQHLRFYKGLRSSCSQHRCARASPSTSLPRPPGV